MGDMNEIEKENVLYKKLLKKVIVLIHVAGGEMGECRVEKASLVSSDNHFV